MASTVVSLRIDTGVAQAYQTLAKRLQINFATLLREILFIALIRVDGDATGHVRFKASHLRQSI